MEGIKIQVTGNVARVIERPARITAGTVGLPVKFSFDSQWDGLSKTAVFRGGRISKIVGNLKTESIVPWELLQKPGVQLSIGVYGANTEGTVVIPTIWANICAIKEGVEPEGDPATEPTLPVWQKLLNDVENVNKELGKVVLEQTRPDWNETDAEKAEYIRNKPAVCQSEAIQGLIFNDLSNNRAISIRSSAFGQNTLAGCKGYYWHNLDTKNKTLMLSATQLVRTEIESIPYEVGDMVSISDDSRVYFNCSVIAAIEGSKITLDNIPDGVIDNRGTAYFDLDGIYACDFGVWVLSKPELGVVDLGVGSFASGCSTIARGFGAGASGYLTKALGHFSTSEGLRTTALGARSHAEGSDTLALHDADHAEGYNTQATGGTSHAEGNGTRAEGRGSHAEGGSTESNGELSHAEGNKSKANGKYTHAEGSITEANGDGSHTEGANTKTSGKYAHAEGYGSHAKGSASHAEGKDTYAGAAYTHTEGVGTQATGEAQHVQGRYNKTDKSLAYILGNGTDANNRSNAHTIDWGGNAWFAGDVYVGGAGQDSADGKMIPWIESTDYPGCYKHTVIYYDSEGRNPHRATEWLNPPMEDGVEYRTTKRCFGKPVYVQAGVIPEGTPLNEAGRIQFAVSESNQPIDRIVSLQVFAKNNEGNAQFEYPIPMHTVDGGLRITCAKIGTRTFAIYPCGGLNDLTAYSFTYLVEYTK